MLPLLDICHEPEVLVAVERLKTSELHSKALSSMLSLVPL